MVAMKAIPVVSALAACTDSVVAGPGLTVIELKVKVRETVTVSVAVIVWLPAVFNVTEKFPVPFVNCASFGKFAWISELVKCTVPV